MQQPTECITPPSRRGLCGSPEVLGTTCLLLRPPPCRETRDSPRSEGRCHRARAHIPGPRRNPSTPLPTRRDTGSAASRQDARQQPNRRDRAAPRAPQRTRSRFSGAAALAQAHKDSDTGSEKAAFIEGVRRSEAQAEVPSPHSGFTRRCPRRSGALHRGALGGLRLLLAVLWFHGGEE